MVFLAFLFFFIFSHPAYGETPLFYQLLNTYYPESSATRLIISAPAPTIPPPAQSTSPISGQVLGLSSSPTPTLPPIGGEGPVYTIALLGDSMIDTLGQNFEPLQKSLANYFPYVKFNLLNYGYGASTIDFALKRLSNNYTYLGKNIPSLLSQNPDIIVVESFAYNNYGNTQAGFDQYQKNLDQIIATIKSTSPNTKIVMAATISPNSAIFAKNTQNLHLSTLGRLEKVSTIKIYLDRFTQYATSNKLILADAYHPSLFNQEGLKDFISTADNIHPSPLGQQLFCDTLAKTISKSNILN